MKLIIVTLAFVASIALSGVAAEKPSKSTKLMHVVAFKFKSTASQEQIQSVVDSFRALQKKIRQIKGFEWGTNVSPEKHDKGFTHAFTLTFKTEKDRDEYLVHPDHQAFGKSLGPVLEDVFVVDYWAQK